MFKILVLIISIAVFSSCNGQMNENQIHPTEEWELALSTPTKDSLDGWCQVHADSLVRIHLSDISSCEVYFLQEKTFTGWACSVLPDNRHKYRYEQFENGIMIRRIGYYDNGQVDADFRLRNCQNYGPSRMWLYHGGLYIDEYFSKPGVKHGVHKRWYANGQLAREAKYEDGSLIYERLFDSTGKSLPRE